MELPGSWPYPIVGGLIAFTVVVYLLLGKGRRSLGTVVLPLLLFPIAAAWFVAVLQIIRGFRGMAESGSGGVGTVVSILLAAIETVHGGFVVSLIALVVALVLGAIAVSSHPSSDATSVDGGRSWVVMSAAALSLILAVSTMQLGFRCLVLPLPVLTSEMEVDPERTAYSTRASASFDFAQEGSEGIGAVAAYIARALTAAALLSGVACLVAGIGFVLSWILAMGASLSRATAVTGLVLSGLAILSTLLELPRLVSLAAEVEYIREVASANAEARAGAEAETNESSDSPEPSKGAGATQLEGHVQAPEKIVDVAPIYPNDARRARIEGQVVLEAIIDTEGNVTSVRVLESIEALDQAAMDAVRQWKYEPAILEGVAVPIVMTITVTFTLD